MSEVIEVNKNLNTDSTSGGQLADGGGNRSTSRSSVLEPRMQASIRLLLNPKSVALIGASNKAQNRAGAAARLLAKFDYQGEVWPVHPVEQEVAGFRCYQSIADLPSAPDLALVGLGAKRVAPVVEELARRGTRAGVALANGFAESGEQGRDLQDHLAELCRRESFALLGPNCLGSINFSLGLTATFASVLFEGVEMRAGSISMIGQSGGLLMMLLALAQRRGLAFRHVLSTGNEAVLTVADLIEALADDPGTSVIAAYLEGASDGDRLLDALRHARDVGKPVVILKGGVSAQSAAAAAAHTGTLAGEGRVWESALRTAGAFQVRSTSELLDAITVLSARRQWTASSGDRVAIVTFGGGAGVLSADYCAQNGLLTPSLGADATERLEKLVPPTASVANPIDLTPQMSTENDWRANLSELFDVVVADSHIDSVVMQLLPMAVGGVETSRSIASFAARSVKPTFVSFPLATDDELHEFNEFDVRLLDDHEGAVRLAARLIIEPTQQWSATPLLRTLPEWPRNVAAGTVFAENACHELLRPTGLDLAPGALATSEADAADQAERMGTAVALKAISPSITHRASLGLVRIGLSGAGAVREGYRAIVERATTLGYPLEGVYVSAMAPEGEELILSGFRDPTFGPIISCGAGGAQAELIDDVVMALAPISVAEAERTIRRLRLMNHRTPSVSSAASLTQLAEYVARFSEIVSDAPWERFVIELNPVRWFAGGALAVDGLIIVEQP